MIDPPPGQADARGAGTVGHPDEVRPERASFIEGRHVARGGEPQSEQQEEDGAPSQGHGNDPPAPMGGLVAMSPVRALGDLDHDWGTAITTNRGAVA